MQCKRVGSLVRVLGYVLRMRVRVFMLHRLSPVSMEQLKAENFYQRGALFNKSFGELKWLRCRFPFVSFFSFRLGVLRNLTACEPLDRATFAGSMFRSDTDPSFQAFQIQRYCDV